MFLCIHSALGIRWTHVTICVLSLHNKMGAAGGVVTSSRLLELTFIGVSMLRGNQHDPSLVSCTF